MTEHGTQTVDVGCRGESGQSKLQYVGPPFNPSEINDKNPILMLVEPLRLRGHLISVDTHEPSLGVIKTDSEGEKVTERLLSTPKMRLLYLAFIGCNVRHFSYVEGCGWDDETIKRVIAFGLTQEASRIRREDRFYARSRFLKSMRRRDPEDAEHCERESKEVLDQAIRPLEPSDIRFNVESVVNEELGRTD